MKTALIVGCADSIWRDIEAAKKLFTPDAVYCVKMAGIYWPEKFKAWVSLHPEWMRKYESEREERGYPRGYEIVIPLKTELGGHGRIEIGRRVSYRWPGMNASASSGIYGAKVALDDGFDRVVLAGIPMQHEQNHFIRGKEWKQCGAFLNGLHQAIPFMRGKVKSMSGLTKELLGYPTPSWIAGEPQ